MKLSHLLVTGGAGFLGSNFVERTLAMKPELQITVLDKLTYAGKRSKLPNDGPKFKFVQGDILDDGLVFELMKEADLVLHFAAETHNDNSLINPRLFFETNVMGTETVARAATKLAKRFHHISTDEVFGDLPLGSVDRFNTNSQYRPSSPYSASKAASDHLVRAYARSFGLQATITNCSNNFGPNQNWEKLIPNSIRRALSGKAIPIYGDGKNVRDWIHVDDHTDGVWAVIELGVVGDTYLLGGDNQLDNLSIAKRILQILSMPEDFIEFVGDRPGHDRRYGIDYSMTHSKLGWQPERTKDFDKAFEEVVCHFRDKILSGEPIE